MNGQGKGNEEGRGRGLTRWRGVSGVNMMVMVMWWWCGVLPFTFPPLQCLSTFVFE